MPKKRMDFMTKEKFMNVRWNNSITLGLGIPFLIYVIFAISTSIWSSRNGMIGLSVFGACYWIIIEGHTAMRFAWLKKNSDNYDSVKPGLTHRLTIIQRVYNAAYWIFLLPFFTIIDYKTGFVAFTINIFVRLGANLYINFMNLKPEQYDSFPLRIP